MPADNSNAGIIYLNYGTPQQVYIGTTWEKNNVFNDERTRCAECGILTTELIDDRCHVCDDDRR
jgi:recombinational DNA repair protein RecR